MRGFEVTSLINEDTRKYIEIEENVIISDNGKFYTRGERDDTYGWSPIPDEWIEAATRE